MVYNVPIRKNETKKRERMPGNKPPDPWFVTEKNKLQEIKKL